MAPFIGIVLGPLAFLGSVSVVYALIPWACAKQVHGWLDAVPAIALLVVLIALLPAWRGFRTSSGAEHGTQRRRFLAAVSLGESALFAVALMAQWAVQSSLSPCVS